MGLALGGILVALLLVEGVLRLTHPRYAGAASVQWVDDMDLGYHRKAGHVFSAKHPDTGAAHRVVHNNLGMRLHRQVRLPPAPGTTVHAFFGDSFTENIYLPVTLSFTEVLHYLLNLGESKAEVLNFGVDGYGPGQELLAFRRFRQTYPGVRLDHVYYVHCGNDLRNLLETRLFTLNAEGGLVQARRRPPGMGLRLARRLYLTYFLLERGVIDRAKLVRFFGDGAGPLYQDDHGAVQDPRFARQRKRLRAVLKPGMEQETRQMQEGELPQAHPGLRLFYAVLQAWHQEVESQGGTFHIMLLPDVSARGLAQQLARQFSVLATAEAFLIDTPGHYIEQEMYLNKDVHWNGLANLLTADALNRWNKLKFASTPRLKDPRVDLALGPWTAATAPRWLDRMYSAEDAARFKAIPEAELGRIVAPYLALEK